MNCQKCGYPVTLFGNATEGKLCVCGFPPAYCIGCGRNAKRDADGVCVLCKRTLARVEKLIAGGQR